MRFKARFLSILIASVAASVLTVSPVDAAPLPGQITPDFKVVSTSGQTIGLENYRGFVLILDFFASWCQPCRLSIPHLVEMNRKYGKKGLQILGLNIEEDGEQGFKSLTKEFRINYPLAFAGDRTRIDFGIRSVPVMYLINKKGVIAEVYRGYTKENSRSIEQSIKRLLEEK